MSQRDQVVAEVEAALSTIRAAIAADEGEERTALLTQAVENLNAALAALEAMPAQ